MALKAKERSSLVLEKITKFSANLPAIRSPASTKTLPPSLLVLPSAPNSGNKINQSLPKIKSVLLDQSTNLEPPLRTDKHRQTLSPNMSPRKLESEVSKAVKFSKSPRMSEPNGEEIKEESNQRFKTIWTYIREMSESKAETDKQEVKLNEKKFMVESEKITELAGKAFSVLNIHTKIILEPCTDSAMTLFPPTDVGELSNFYYMVLQEVSDFPYSFLAKLKIFLITICEDVLLANASYMKFLKQKMHNGLFIISKVTDRDALRDHWYRILLYHFVKQNPGLYEKWKEYFGDERRNEMDDMVQTLSCLMRPGKTSKVGLSRPDLKIRLLKEELVKFEPNFFDDEWWTLKRSEQAK